MRIIFLDVDGVLNCHDTFVDNPALHALETAMVERLLRIVNQTGAKVVLSSTWRHGQAPKRLLEEAGIVLLDQTPDLGNCPRCAEITHWMQHRSIPDAERDVIDDYVILDDDPSVCIPGHYYQTQYHCGLTEQIVDDILERWQR